MNQITTYPRFVVEECGKLANGSCSGRGGIGWVSAQTTTVHNWKDIAFTASIGEMKQMKKHRQPYESQGGILICVMEEDYRNKKPLGASQTAIWLEHLRDVGPPDAILNS